VRDDDGKFLTHGEVGEIIIRTPRIMKGYAGRKDDSALPDGWRRIGDVVAGSGVLLRGLLVVGGGWDHFGG